MAHTHIPLTPSRRHDPCDLCAHTDFLVVAERDRHGEELTTVICRACGLLSHERIPTDAELEQYYARQYRAAYHGEYAPSAYRVLREWDRGRALVKLLSPYVRPDDRIVEIGCGIGCTVKNFECAGFETSGIEPGEGFRKFAVNKLRADVRDGVLHSLPARPTADMVLLVHVLEHLRDPTHSLQHIHTILRANGRLYVEVPNTGAPHSAPGKMFHFAHIYNFTRDTLEALALKAGFEPIAWLGPRRDLNLRVLLQRAEPHPWQSSRDSYQRTLDALTRYSVVAYHLRWQYLYERVLTILHHAGNRVCAERRLRKLLASCK